MSLLTAGASRFGNDDGSADPAVTAALAAFAGGTGTEHAALTALAASRLLVPLVAALADEAAVPDAAAQGAGGSCGGEKSSEVALPALVGKDGRRAVPAFTSLAALTRWRPGARLVPALASAVWDAAVQDGCAVVIDVAGPVPLAVEGARLAALASGEPVPWPHQDPDVLAAVTAAAAQQPVPPGIELAPGEADGELVIRLALPAGSPPSAAAELAAAIGAGVMASLGGRLRQGLSFEVTRAGSG